MPTIAVIGAGLAGLTAARALTDAGRRVVVFEKSRGLGGRLATRRTAEGWWFDHGAPVVHARPGPFEAFCAEAAAAGRARRAPGGWAGRPGMSGLVGGLIAGVDVRFGAEVDPPEREGGRWRVAGERFDAVVCAVPAPQALRLCAAAPGPRAAAEAARMTPCWTLMAAWGAQAPSPPEGPTCVGGPFAEIRADATEGGAPGPRWVAHARVDWTEAHLDRPREEVAALLVAALSASAGGPVDAPRFAQAHRWRYARTATPAGAPCVAADGFAIAGDWLLGPEAADAHASGLAAAAALA